MRAAVAGTMLACAALSTACIDEARVNTTCHWSDGVAGTLDLTRAADREHLRQDAQVAWEVGLRYADARYAHQRTLARPLLRACRAAMTDSIVARHGVTLTDIDRATYARVWWVDVAVVFVPMLVVIALGMDAVARIVALPPVASVGLVALVGAGATQLWAIILESLRLRNGHVSGRVVAVPSIAHAGITLATACVICTAVVAWRMAHARDDRRPD